MMNLKAIPKQELRTTLKIGRNVRHGVLLVGGVL
jgi:hypothetical protein